MPTGEILMHFGPNKILSTGFCILDSRFCILDSDKLIIYLEYVFSRIITYFVPNPLNYADWRNINAFWTKQNIIYKILDSVLNYIVRIYE